MTYRCPTCDLQLAVPPQHDPERDVGREDLCWLRWGHNQCTGVRVDWRERAMRATDVDALIGVIEETQRMCHRNQWLGVSAVQRKIAEAIRAYVIGEEFNP